MTDALLFEIRRRINRSKAKRVTYTSLENSRTLQLKQVQRVVAAAVEAGKLRAADGYLFEPAPAPVFGGTPPMPRKKTKAQLKKEAPLPGQLSFGSDD